MSFNVEKIRSDFPILQTKVRGRDLVYFDNAATSQRPKEVLAKIDEVYSHFYSNVHRGVHFLSGKSTSAYEDAREKIAKFIAVEKASEIIYTRGTTEGLNIVAHCWGQDNIKAGDEIVVTALEHHSNFVPWQNLAIEKQAKFTIIEVDSKGRIQTELLEQVLQRKPKLFAFSMMSNAIGVLNPVRDWAKRAKEVGATVVVDAAQGVVHGPMSIPDLGPIDFCAFSAHKMCGPTGFGVLWGRTELLKSMRPYLFGGDMIEHVHDDHSTWNILPWKFEAGTPNIVGAIAFAAAIDYLEAIGMKNIQQYEQELSSFAREEVAKIEAVDLYGESNPEKQGGIVSFTVPDIHPHDIASYLDSDGIATRTGHLCAQPLMRRLGVEGINRASLYFYNTEAEVLHFVKALRAAIKLFQQ